MFKGTSYLVQANLMEENPFMFSEIIHMVALRIVVSEGHKLISTITKA